MHPGVSLLGRQQEYDQLLSPEEFVFIYLGFEVLNSLVILAEDDSSHLAFLTLTWLWHLDVQ